jgi:hypothetical protein
MRDACCKTHDREFDAAGFSAATAWSKPEAYVKTKHAECRFLNRTVEKTPL